MIKNSITNVNITLRSTKDNKQDNRKMKRNKEGIRGKRDSIVDKELYYGLKYYIIDRLTKASGFRKINGHLKSLLFPGVAGFAGHERKTIK